MFFVSGSAKVFSFVCVTSSGRLTNELAFQQILHTSGPDVYILAQPHSWTRLLEFSFTLKLRSVAGLDLFGPIRLIYPPWQLVGGRRRLE